MGFWSCKIRTTIRNNLIKSVCRENQSGYKLCSLRMRKIGKTIKRVLNLKKKKNESIFKNELIYICELSSYQKFSFTIIEISEVHPVNG